MEPIIGLPNSITLIRHGESACNALAARKESEPVYQKLIRAYDRSPTSRKTRDLAEKVQKIFAPQWGDHDTPLTPEGVRQSKVVGQTLGYIMPPPDVIFVSPYERTTATARNITESWPRNTTVAVPTDLPYEYRERKRYCTIDRVETISEILLREQKYGLGILFNDWRVFQALMPEQKTYRDLEGPYWYQYPQGESIPDVQTRARLFHNDFIMKCAGKDLLIASHHRWILAYVANQEGLRPDEVLALDHNDPPVNCGLTIYKNVSGKLELECYNKKIWK